LSHTFFLHNPQAIKRDKLMPVDVLLYQFNECEGTRSLDDLLNFRESEKRLTMDSVGVPFSYVGVHFSFLLSKLQVSYSF
jgi:hypothetical protein